MLNLDQELGVKSYTFREITDLNVLSETIKQCGTNLVDLSGCHVNYDDRANQEKVLEVFEKHGIVISGIGVVQAKNDEAFNARFFDFAKMAGCKIVSCNLPPEDHESTLKILHKLALKHGFKVALHNHGGKHWLGNSTILKYLFDRTGPEIGLCLDTAWALQAGEDPVKWLDLFGERLYGSHFKDFVFERNGKAIDTVVGKGSLDLSGFLKKLKQISPSGSFVVEYEGPEPVEATRESVENVRKAWAKSKSLVTA